MNGAPVSIQQVVKTYGDVLAVDNVSLDVNAGEFLSLLGPSGSGKTTLLMMLAGFEMPNQGKMIVGGRDITYVLPNKRNIGMVFQKYALFPHMTIAENIGYPLKMRKIPRSEIKRRVQDALDLVRLGTFGKRLPSQLSGGQQQRVAVARAMVFEPPLLLMDEPLGALDKKLREQLQIEIKSLQERSGATVVYVTHDQEEALTMSDRIAVMRDGILEQIGTPTDLYRSPKSAFVADFIGKMNFIVAEVRSQSGGKTAVSLSENHVIEFKRLEDCAAKLEVGQKVRLAVRPEVLSVERADFAGPNTIDAVVEVNVFVGTHHILIVNYAELEPGVLHIEIADGAKGADFVKGDKIRVVVDPRKCSIFDNRGAEK